MSIFRLFYYFLAFLCPFTLHAQEGSKIVAGKAMQVQSVSYTRNPRYGSTNTFYYIIATDKTICQVSMIDYALTEAQQRYTCPAWESYSAYVADDQRSFNARQRIYDRREYHARYDSIAQAKQRREQEELLFRERRKAQRLRENAALRQKP